jgi:hypothetical protein
VLNPDEEAQATPARAMVARPAPSVLSSKCVYPSRWHVATNRARPMERRHQPRGTREHKGAKSAQEDAEGVSNESEKVEMALNVYAPNGKVATHRECT